jgi:hypothetical protein
MARKGYHNTGSDTPEGLTDNMATASDQTPNVRPEAGVVHRSKPTTVKFKDWRHEKLVRLAAVEDNISRSEFIADAAVEKARRKMSLNRDADFHRWIEEQAA